ncbi:MAG: M48 family metalloprotease [bacterium]|nr:M48 family metalloprotease [bacterium]
MARAFALILAALLTGCATLTLKEEEQLGRELEREVRRDLRMLRDRVVNDYITDLGERLLAAAGPQPFDYSFSVVEDEEINAFAMPAGAIYIHTETILAAGNMSELAGVMAHEIGHVVYRHTAENYNRARATGWVHQAAVVGAGMAGGSAAAGAANLLGGLSAMAFINSYGREAERESDAFAAELLPSAGIHPEGTWTFFETLAAEEGAHVPAFLASHPAPAERLDTARKRSLTASLPPDLRMDDGGRLEIIQRRIELLMGYGSLDPTRRQRLRH